MQERNARTRRRVYREIPPADMEFSHQLNRDVMALLAELLSNQYVFFAVVSTQ